MFGSKECSNDTEQGCRLDLGVGATTEQLDEWLEETVWYGMRMWHVIFLSIGAVLSFVILLCCCFKFRIPRTKQEIEGDYIRRKIMRKFRKRLKAIQNQELDEMDLKKALDKIRTELKSDTESLQQSDVLSGATLSSAGGINPAAGSTYRRASQIQIDISLEDLRIQSMGLGARIALAFTRFFGAPKKTPQQTGDSDEENGGNGMGDVGSDKPTTALLPPKKQGAASTSATTTGGGKGEEQDTKKKKKDKGDEQKGKDATGIELTTTSKEKSAKTPGEKKASEEKNKKDKKKEPTNTTPPTAAATTTVIVTTEKETGSSDKKQDKKSTSNNKKEDKGKKEKDQNKSKTEAGAAVTASAASKDEKVAGKKATVGTDKKNNESHQQKK